MNAQADEEPLSDVVVVSLEQAVAAPICISRPDSDGLPLWVTHPDGTMTLSGTAS